MTPRPIGLTILIGALALPATAGAQILQPPADTTTQPAPTAPTPAPAPAAPPAAALHLAVERAGRSHATLVRSRFRVRGSISPYVAGEKVTVRITRGKSVLRVKSLALRPSSTGKSGGFVLGYSARKLGTLSVSATHDATAALGAADAKTIALRVLPSHVAKGSRGSAVRSLQASLRSLGYEVGRRGHFDARTARAILSFRKMTGMARTSQANRAVMRKLAAGKGAFKVRYPNHGRHFEGDLTHQVLAEIGDGGKVEHLFTMSSGKASTPTVLGHFKVYRKDAGFNGEGMFDSSYFIGGYAIHGYKSVPTYSASHGCMRVPIPDAPRIFAWSRYGTRVDVYYR